jgi:hypothetical protein
MKKENKRENESEKERIIREGQEAWVNLSALVLSKKGAE